MENLLQAEGLKKRSDLMLPAEALTGANTERRTLSESRGTLASNDEGCQQIFADDLEESCGHLPTWQFANSSARGGLVFALRNLSVT